MQSPFRVHSIPEVREPVAARGRVGGGDGVNEGALWKTLRPPVFAAFPDALLLQQRNWQRPRKSTRAVTCPSPTRPPTECSGTRCAVGTRAWPSPWDGCPDAEGWPCLGAGRGSRFS